MSDPVFDVPRELEPAAARPRSLALLRVRDFRNLFAAVAASELGDSPQYISSASRRSPGAPPTHAPGALHRVHAPTGEHDAMGFLERLSCRAHFAVLTALVVALGAAASSAGAPPTLKDKQAQAKTILAEIQRLDIRSGRAVEAWNGAQYELKQIESAERRNAAQLRTARQGYKIAEQRAAARIVAIYESDEPTAADAIMGATSLSEILDRLEVVHAAASLDRRIATEVQVLRDQLTQRAAALAAARERKAQTVIELAQRRREIESELSRRKQLLASVQGEVQKLQAEEAARQAKLAAEAHARLIADQRRLAAQQAAAKARAQAAADAAAAAARTASTRPATTTPASTTPPSEATDPTTTDSTTTTDPTVTTPSSPDTPPAVQSPGHPQAATVALQYLGVPYLWSGATPAGFDCSGLVMYVYAQLGISLPHFAAAQYGFGTPVARDQLQPGDLVFFDNLNHVGISLGGNQFVHAPHTGDVVKIDSITGWYAQHYVGARRI